MIKSCIIKLYIYDNFIKFQFDILNVIDLDKFIEKLIMKYKKLGETDINASIIGFGM